MIKINHYSLLVVLLSGLSVVNTAQAVLNIEITKGIEGAVPIAIVPFAWQATTLPGQPGLSASPQNPPVDVSAVISADLARTGRFNPLSPGDMLSRPNADAEINFANWRIFQTENLVVGTLQYLGADRYKITVRIYDVFRGKRLEGFNLSASGSNLRRAAHLASDRIYEKLTGEPGAFATNVAYITAEKQGNKKRYTMWVADADGYNAQAMMKSSEPIISPAWSPDGTKLAYASAEYDKSQKRMKWSVYVQEVTSGRREKAIFSHHPNSAPAWSPDGKSLAVKLDKDGNAEIYIIDLAGKKARRLTNHWATDTEPVWTPDGKSIIFSSDRGGSLQLYRIPVSGGRVERLTYDGLSNGKASISSDGRLLAMAHQVGRADFRIAVLDLESGNLRVLTEGTTGSLDESPSFAPNGSMIIYATSSGVRGVLAAVSVDGRVQQRLTVQEGDVREPAWSPLN